MTGVGLVHEGVNVIPTDGMFTERTLVAQDLIHRIPDKIEDFHSRPDIEFQSSG